jgi:hypothetical protein
VKSRAECGERGRVFHVSILALTGTRCNRMEVTYLTQATYECIVTDMRSSMWAVWMNRVGEFRNG